METGLLDWAGPRIADSSGSMDRATSESLPSRVMYDTK